jgi:hypothetical protein
VSEKMQDRARKNIIWREKNVTKQSERREKEMEKRGVCV